MKLTKRLLSMLIAAVMVLSMIPAVYAAETEVSVGTVEELNEQIQALQDATEAMTLTITLTDDIVMTQELKIPYGIAHNVTINMDGHKLSATDAIRAFNLHAGTLTVNNGAIEMPGINCTSGVTAGNDNQDWELEQYGGIIIVYKANLNLNDVTVKKVKTDNAVAGGGVLYVRSLSNVKLNNSHIIVEQDDTYDASSGGAVTMTNYKGTPKLYLVSSSVSGGYAQNYGGNFIMSGSAEVHIDKDSSVFGGKVSKESKYGGGNFYNGNKASRIYLNGGQIYGGITEAGNGGNLRINAGQLHMNGGKIYGGIAKAVSDATTKNTYAGNVHLNGADAHLYMNGGEIYDGLAQSYTGYTSAGGNIYLISGSITINGGGKIYNGQTSGTNNVNGGNIYCNLGTITLNDGEIYGGQASGGSASSSKSVYGGNIYNIGGTLNINGGKIYDGSTVSAYSAHGGNIYMTVNGTTYPVAIMNGGEITGGHVEGTKEIYGAAVAVMHGRFILNDGLIGRGTAKKLTTTTSGGSTGVQIYNATKADAAGNLDAFHMYGGVLSAMAGKDTAIFLHEGKTAVDLSTFVADCSEITTEKVDGYYVVSHKNTDGTENDVAATCTAAGKINVTCADCTVTAGGTTYGGTYTYEIPATGHDYDEGVVTTNPSCTAEGVKTFTCKNDASHTYTEAVEATGHTEVIDEAVAPDCTNTGLTQGSHCSVCGETIVVQEEVPSLGHAYTGVKTEATFESDAYTTYTCGTCGDSYTEIHAGTQLRVPVANVGKVEPQTLKAGEYAIYNGSLVESTEDLPLEVIVNFQATETEAGSMKDWLVDFNLTFTGMENGSIVANNCYLAGNYGTFGWIAIPTDGMELQEGVTYPVVAVAGIQLTYNDIVTSVKDFTAAIHIDQAILDANPNLQVNLELVMTNPQDETQQVQVGEDMIYTAEDLQNQEELVPPVAEVTPMDRVTLEDGGYRVWNGIVSDKESEALVTGEGELPLEVVVNFKAMDTLEECLAGGYAKWLVDFNITIEGLESGSFVADNCYLAGNYGSYGWIAIPLDGQTIEEGIAYPVVALFDPTLNYKDICKSVKDFTAAIHIDQAILDANPDMTVKLELVMTNPEDAEDTLQIGEDLIYGYDALLNGVVAQNKDTGAVYTSVKEALKAAGEGETVVLLGDHEETQISVGRGKTLDLNGYTLTTGLMSAPYATSYVIDSTEGEGMLIVDRNYLALYESNPQLAIFVQEGEVTGFRFMSVELRQNAKLVSEDVAQFRFYIRNGANDCVLQQAMANGGSNSYIYVQVTLDWTDVNGNSATKDYVYSDEMLKLYAAGWDSKEFRLNISGMEYVSELQLTAKVVYGEVTEEAGKTVINPIVAVPGTTQVLTK